MLGLYAEAGWFLMAHECEQCGQQCYCDQDDMGGLPQPNSCRHLWHTEACPNHPDRPEEDDYPEEDPAP